MEFAFNQAISGFGSQVQANFYGAFTAVISAYDAGNVMLGSFTVNGVKGAPGLQCDASTPAPSVPVRLPSVGFRCCLTGQMP